VWQPPTSDVLDAYGDRLLEAVHRRGVKRLFVDGLTAFKNATLDPTRIAHFFTALANELRLLGVTSFYTLEVPDIFGPLMRAPIDDMSSVSENLIVLRYIELRSRLHRMISIIKARDSDFNASLHEFTITAGGLEIHETPETAEAILLSLGSMPLLTPKRNRTPTRGGA